MKSIVVWLWNDDATAAEVPPPPPKPEPAPLLKPEAPAPGTPYKRKETWRDRVEARRKGLYRPPKVRQPQFGRPRPPPREFAAANVNIQARAFRRHLREPHRYICISDSNEGLDPAVVEHLPTPPEARVWGSLKSPEGTRFPSCYRRLWNFSEAAKVLGDRIMASDIDAIPVADIAPMFAQEDDFVGWVPERAWGLQHRFGGGTYLLTPGTKTHVWDRFRGLPSIHEARTAGFRGSDQAWMSYQLVATETYFPRNSGIHSVREMGPQLDLPRGARLIHFNGPRKPWNYGHIPWIAANWRNV